MSYCTENETYRGECQRFFPIYPKLGLVRAELSHGQGLDNGFRS